MASVIFGAIHDSEYTAQQQSQYDLMGFFSTTEAQDLPSQGISTGDDGLSNPTSRHDPHFTIQPVVRPPIAFRPRGVSNEDWERHRPRITRLYIHEERKLEDVRRIMREEYGLAATVQMYKKRFAAWKLRKNYTEQQKEDVIRLQASQKSPALRFGDQARPIVVNSKQLKQHRIDRHQRQKRRLQNFRERCQVSRVQLQHSEEYHNAELYLVQVKYLYSQYTLHNLNNAKMRRGAAGLDVFDCIDGAVCILSVDNTRAFALLNKACVKVPEMVRDSSFDSMYMLLTCCGGGSRWHGYPEIRLALAQYINASSLAKLGPLHPLTMITALLLQEIAWSDTMERVAMFVNECCDQTADASIDDAWVWYMRHDVCDMLVRLGNLDLALKSSLGLVKQKTNNQFQGRVLFEIASHSLAVVQYQIGEEKVAEHIWKTVIQNCAEETGCENGTWPVIKSCWWLGMLCSDRHEDADAERYFRLALDGALNGWGADDPETGGYLHDLEDFFEERNRQEDIAELRKRYVEVYASLDPYYLM